MTEWQKPGKSTGDREFFKYKDNEGALLGIHVRRFEADVETRFKEIKDTVFADIKVFDGDHAGKSYDNVDLTATALVSILKDKERQDVLARLVKTKNYWDLKDPTDKDFAIAGGAQAEPEPKKAPWEK